MLNAKTLGEHHVTRRSFKFWLWLKLSPGRLDTKQHMCTIYGNLWLRKLFEQMFSVAGLLNLRDQTNLGFMVEGYTQTNDLMVEGENEPGF